MDRSTRSERVDGTGSSAPDQDRVEPEFLIVGQIKRPHGVRGEVFVVPLTDAPEAIFDLGSEILLGDAEGELEDEAERLVIETIRPYRDGFLISWVDYPDRTAVTALGGKYLLLPRESLAPLEEDEFHYHQLLGLKVVTVEGAEVGRVREVFDTDPTHLLEVKGEAGIHLIPFAKRIVEEVDLKSGLIVIDPPEGLLEL